MVSVNLAGFIREREAAWAELEALLAAAGRRPERLGADQVRRMGALYRGAAADLAAARRRFPAEPAVARLEHLVGRARHVVYDSEGRRDSVRTFVTTTYWRRIRERPAVLAVAALLLIAPAALSATWGWRDPSAAIRFVPEEYAVVTEPRDDTDLDLRADESAGIAGQIFTNNIRVTFFAFAGGITLGVLTGYVLVFNGMLLGTLTGLAIGAGNGDAFMALVLPHGLLELSCIVVAGVAGLRMGWAVIAPGHRRRVEVLQEEARAAAELALGTAAWLVLAGLVEGFITPLGLPTAAAFAVGATLAAAYWALAVFRGGPGPSAAGTH